MNLCKYRMGKTGLRCGAGPFPILKFMNKVTQSKNVFRNLIRIHGTIWEWKVIYCFDK